MSTVEWLLKICDQLKPMPMGLLKLLGLLGWQSISHMQKSTWTWITRGTWQASKQIPPESGPWDLFRKIPRFPFSREIDGTCSALSDLHPFASFALKWSSSDLQVILSEVGSDLPCDAQTVYSAGTFHESLLLLQQGEGQVWVQHSDFSLEPPPLPGHFEAVLEADGHGLKSCQVSRQSVSFTPPLGLKFDHRPRHPKTCHIGHVGGGFN